jgi:cellulase/cellobiase CelA1
MNTSRKLVLVTLVALAATVLFAQDKSKKGEPELRTVRGTVVDKDEAPVDSAVVYLKNAHTQDITTHISDPDGQFRFTGLDLNIDYEIHAEHEGWTSSSRSVSNFDTRKEFVLTLKLDHKKTGK